MRTFWFCQDIVMTVLTGGTVLVIGCNIDRADKLRTYIKKTFDVHVNFEPAQDGIYFMP